MPENDHIMKKVQEFSAGVFNHVKSYYNPSLWSAPGPSSAPETKAAEPVAVAATADTPVPMAEDTPVPAAENAQPASAPPLTDESMCLRVKFL